MELSQKVEIPVAPDTVWRALTDPDVLQRSLPGCEAFEPAEDDQDGKYAFVVLAKVGPVKARFKGEVELTNVNAPHSYTLAGSGKGGVAGFAKGAADVRLEPLESDGGEAHTVMTYIVNATVGGKLAQLGSRLVGGTARKMANDFFVNFVKVVTDDEDFDVKIETIKSEG